MAALPYLKFYAADYLADTAHLTTLEHGAYLLLIFTYWQRGESFRANDERTLNKRLATVARLSNEEWASVRETLSEFFNVCSTEWRHERIERDLVEVKDKANKCKNAGQARGMGLKGQKIGIRSTDAQRTLSERSADAQRTLNHTDTDTDTDTDKTPLTPLGGEEAPDEPEPKARKPDFDPLAVDLPDGLPEHRWRAWIAYRRHRRLTCAEVTITRQLDALRQWGANGHDPGDILDDSIRNGWQGLFEPKAAKPPPPEPVRRSAGKVFQ